MTNDNNIRIRPTKAEKCFPFFKLNPFPSEKEMNLIAEEVGCIQRTVYRGYALYRKKHPEIYKEAAVVSHGVNVKDVMASEEKKTKEAKNKNAKPVLTIPKGIDFITFASKFSYPFYPGLYRWQELCHKQLWESDSKFLEILNPRDSGKSIYLADLFQWLMDPDAGGMFENEKFVSDEWDILYLGWTDRRKEVAEFVYNYFIIRGLLLPGKRNSEYHFKLTTGAQFDTYLITSKDTLGKHSIGNFGRVIDAENEVLKEFIRSDDGRKLLICIDDPIDISFMDERHKETNLERKFDSTIYNINPDRFMFVGTKKFDGDFFNFIENKFGSKLVRWIKQPVLLMDDPMRMNTAVDEVEVLCPERFTCVDLLTYEQDLLDGKKDLYEIRDDIGEYMWSAEYCQDPHPITGEVWDKVEFEKMMKPWPEYDICVISIDRATTTDQATSSHTGYIIELREAESGERLVIEDFTDLWEFEELMKDVNDYIVQFHSIYLNIDIYLVLERQGGGDDFYSSAKGRGMPFLDCCVVVMVWNVRQKTERIKNYLYAPIKNGRCKFLYSLRNSNLVRQLLQFPHGLRVDGPDALANAEHQIDIAEEIPPAGVLSYANLSALAANLRLQALKKKSNKNDEFNILADKPYHRLGGWTREEQLE